MTQHPPMTSDSIQTADAGKVVAEWRAAMEGVTPGPWRPSRFGFQVVSDYPEPAWQSVVELTTVARSEPNVEREMLTQKAIANWLARCSPSGISGLLALIESQRATIERVERERDVAYEHSMREPDGQTHTMFSRSQDNPWSHWLQKHRDTCVYSCRPLFASPPAPAVKVKALVWNEPTKLTNGCWTADCIFGTYSVAFDDGWYACLEDGSRWEWQPENDPRSYEGPHAAQAACQAHLEARIRSSLLPPSTEAHPDDLAVDRFAAAMKTKLAKKRAEGRGGWEDKDDCSNAFLSQLLREHTDKGDPVDVGNLAMMIHQRGERIG